MRMSFLTGKEAYEVSLFSALKIHSLICLYTNSFDVNSDSFNGVYKVNNRVEQMVKHGRVFLLEIIIQLN